MKTKLNVNESFILGAIQNRTVERPVTSTEINKSLNYESSEVRTCIHNLRKKGVPVVGCREGYYMPTNIHELEIYIDSFSKRIKEMEKVLEAMRKINDVKKWKEHIEHENFYLKNKDNEQIELFFEDIA